MKIRLADPETLKPYPHNPRLISQAAIDKVLASVREFGWRQPIVVDEDGVILVGHTRRLAAIKGGYKQVPVHDATGLSDAQKRAYRLADNRTGEESEWDMPVLATEIAGLRALDFDLKPVGFSAAELAQFVDASLPDLGSDDKPEFEQITFTLHNSQAERVREALKAAKSAGEFTGPNLNGNGNALARVCEAYLGKCKRN